VLAPSATPKAAPSTLASAADAIARQVSALRGLRSTGELKRGVLTREQIGAKLRERLGQEYTPAEVRAEAQVLARLGLLPPTVDYGQLLIDLLMEQIAGFYDPFARQLYIADWLPLEMQRPAMAHEIEHALQDQHFDLKLFATPIKEDGDRQLARSALVEGDGTMLMLEFQAQAMGLPTDGLAELISGLGKQMLSAGGLGAQTPLFEKAPQFIKDTMLFPYLSGLSFVAALKQRGSWARIDEVWRTPPESTEQVLHPEKYLAHEPPVRVGAAALAPLAGKKELRRDVLGELVFRILFEQASTPEEAERAASGWGGDRIVSYEGPTAGLPTLVSLSVWDSEADAREAEEAARRFLAKLTSSAGPLYVDAAGDEATCQRRGERLALVLGAAAGQASALATGALTGWSVSR
jgi:hypothetical protein